MFAEPDRADLSSSTCRVSGVIGAAATAAGALVSAIDPLLAGMVAAGLGLDALEAYLDYSRIELLDRLADLGLPLPHGRPPRRGGRNPWTAADVRAFISLWMSGIRIAAIAAVLGRSPGGIYSKRRRLGLPARPRTGQRDLSSLEIAEWRARLSAAAEEPPPAARPAAVSSQSFGAATPAPDAGCGSEASPPAPAASSNASTEQPVTPAPAADDGIGASSAAGEQAPRALAPGDFIVVPPYGVARFEGIGTELAAGREIEMLSIAIVKSKMKLKIPVSRAGGCGLRRIASPAAADAALAALAMPPDAAANFSSGRKKIESCGLGALAEGVRDLRSRLPGCDVDTRGLYEHGLELLAAEIAVIRHTSEAEIRAEIEARLPRIEAPESPDVEIEASDRDPEVAAFMRDLARRVEMPADIQIKNACHNEVAARVLGGQNTPEIARIMGITPKSVANVVSRAGLRDRSRKRFPEFSRERADQYLVEKGLRPRLCLGKRRLFFTASPKVYYCAEWTKPSEVARREAAGAGSGKTDSPAWKISPNYEARRARLRAEWEKDAGGRRGKERSGPGISGFLAGLIMELARAPVAIGTMTDAIREAACES